MKFFNNLLAYTDGNGLVCPNRQPSPKVPRGSDNGVLFTSQALILGKDFDATVDRGALFSAIYQCHDAEGYLHRASDDMSEDAPDDHYGLFAAYLHYDLRITTKLPWRCMHPMLLYMRGLSGPFSPLWRLLSLPMAALLALSNIGEDLNSTSNKLLTWTMIKGLSKHSLLCALGGLVWTQRMQNIYGTTRRLAEIYYEPGHPFISNWRE